jgi:hypothetical protein
LQKNLKIKVSNNRKQIAVCFVPTGRNKQPTASVI